VSLFLVGIPSLWASVSEDALRLRNLGLAELENEQPAKAEELFRQLVDQTPADPLPLANLAIASLRQQRFDEGFEWIEKALEKSPGQPELLTIKAEILQWSGRPEEALPIFQEAANRAPDNVEIQYALARQASTLPGTEAESARRDALERLRALRPENLVVLMQSGQQLLAAGDRAGATGVFLRVKEVIWQAPPAASTLLEQIFAALETGDFEAARVPSLRLENVVKISPMFKEGLRELSPGIQGVPLTHFRDEPATDAFGEPIAVRFSTTAISETGTTPGGLALGDFDGDQQTDWARLASTDPVTLEIWLSADRSQPKESMPAPGLQRLLAADLDNDGQLDLIGYAGETMRVFRGLGEGSFEEATESFGLADADATAAAILDFDIEGDLDLVTAAGTSGSAQLFLNSLRGPLEPVGDKTFGELKMGYVSDLVASDLDRDGDVDLLFAHQDGLTWLDNLRQGQFADRTEAGGLNQIASVDRVVSVDMDNDGFPDLVTAGQGIGFLHNQGGRFAPWQIGGKLRTNAKFTTLSAFDADNDGRTDLAVGGDSGLAVVGQKAGLDFEFLKIDQPPASINALGSLDLDQDCDLDLIAGGADGLWQLENVGGDKNHCLTVQLRGLDKGNSKNNFFGFGSTLEVRSGRAYQFREVFTDVYHLGLGRLAKADLLRVVWPNGVPQNRFQTATSQRIVEEQVLKGSCPFLYAQQEDGVEFVTDLLWGAPVGLPVAPGIWASSDPQELVKLPGITDLDGQFDLRITEELWEAAFFDYVRLWVVDHPAEVEVASSLRIVPGETLPEKVLGTRTLRPVGAWDSHGDVSERIATRDEVYASPWRESPYQGVAAEPWSLTLDLGEAPATPIRLHLDGWIFPTDASLNLALAQQSALETWPPRLEVETDNGWQALMPAMGFPAGKTKTMVLDTPKLPPGSHKLRIVGTQWLSFDRIVWSADPADEEPQVRARLEPQVADLRFRGFSRMYRPAPNGPHYFDYSIVQEQSPWLPFPGRYTRFGDVRELLATADDRSVILAPGDEIRLLFDASHLPDPPAGWHRTVFLESHGWDKDADRNTGEGQQVEPLPFRAMTTYPYGPDEEFPDSELHRDYLQNWLTRVVSPTPGALPRISP
jgi:Tfp pilus assembly protein PilF